MHCRNEAVITAAGSSNRIGNDIKKEYYFLDDKPVLVHSIIAFLQTDLFSRITITIPDGHEERVKALITPYCDLSLLRFITGGATRQASVFNALESLECENPGVVLIHDGARPWIKPLLIREIVNKAGEKGSCIPVLPLVDSLVGVDTDGYICATLERSHFRAVQTPQGFLFPAIYEAHKQAQQQGIQAPDDSTIYRLIYKRAFCIEGDRKNIKITFRQDLGICG